MIVWLKKLEKNLVGDFDSNLLEVDEYEFQFNFLY